MKWFRVSALLLKDICVFFADKTVLKDISISLDHGMMNMAVGQSGSGKTTPLRAVNRLNEAFSGCRITGTVKIGFRDGVGRCLCSISVSCPFAA
jgi:phosphate transport system ATP-binding protein